MATYSESYVTESSWLLSIQLGWESQIANSDLPYWMRVYAVAMARSEPNLHAPFESGELAELLGKSLPDGSKKAVDRRDLNKYVKKAIALDLLDEISSVRCLVLPASRTACRRSGYKKPCAHHTGKASKIKKPLALKQTASAPLTEIIGTLHCRCSQARPSGKLPDSVGRNKHPPQARATFSQ